MNFNFSVCEHLVNFNLQSRCRPPPNPPTGGAHEGERAQLVVKCNVGRHHGTIVAQRTVFTAQRHISTVYHICMPSLCVCLSVCLPQVGILLKWLNVGSCKGCLIIAQGLQFSDTEGLGKTRPGSPPTEAPKCRWGRLKFATVECRQMTRCNFKTSTVADTESQKRPPFYLFLNNSVKN